MKERGWDPWRWPWQGTRPGEERPAVATPPETPRPRSRRLGRARTLSLVELHERDGGICHICGRECPLDEATRDRVVPGFDGGTYAPENLRLAHRRCNVERGHRRLGP